MLILRVLPVLTVLAIFAPLDAADVVLLTNGQRLYGTIDSTAGSLPGQVTIKTDSGILRLRKEMVVGVEQGYDSRRSQVKDSDFAGLLELAKWCVSKDTRDMKDKAIELLQSAVKLPAATPEARALLARLVDEGKGPIAALPLYLDYRKSGGTDAVTLARLKQLEDVKKAYDANLQTTVEPAQPVTVVNDGLETKGWEPESSQWSNPVETKVVKLDTTEGTNRVLQITYTGGDKGKIAIKKMVNLSITDNAVLSMFINNPEKSPIKIGFALKTGDRYLFYESMPQIVPPNTQWKEFRFNLRGNDFKSEATGWKNTGPVNELSNVKELQFLIYNYNSSGTLSLDNIDFLGQKSL